MNIETVTLGDHEVDVYPQRHAYLTNKLAAFFRELVETDTDINDAAGVVTLLGDRAYDLLGVVLPQYTKRCPLYEFRGYSSESAMEEGLYDERSDKSPSFPEMVGAFETAASVNRFDVFAVLGKVIDPKLLKTWINSKVAEAISTASVSLPAAKDGAASTSSGPSSPTSTESGDSPSRGSLHSLSPETDDASTS